MPNRARPINPHALDALLQHLLSERQWCERVIDAASNTEIAMVMIGWKRGLNEAIEKIETMIARPQTPTHQEDAR